MASGSKVTLRGRFPVGQRVSLYPRLGGGEFVRAQAGTALQRAEVGKDGVVVFDGVEPGTYWVAGQSDEGVWRGVSVTSRVPRPPAKPVKKYPAAEVREILGATRPPQDPSAVIVGPRSTANTKLATTNAGEPFANTATGVPSENPEAGPWPRIEDVPEGVPLKSHTVTGEVHVATDDEGNPLWTPPEPKKPARKRARKPESGE